MAAASVARGMRFLPHSQCKIEALQDGLLITFFRECFVEVAICAPQAARGGYLQLAQTWMNF
jgi:hypothetical protein